jgi:PAS domain S-box-containing protein
MGGDEPADFTHPRLGEFIRSRRAVLIAQWEEEMHRLPKADDLSLRRRIDHIPQILERIAAAADAEGNVAQHLAGAPDAHALERLDEGFDLKEVVREYALLRSIVLRHWEKEVVGGAHPEELVALDLAFDDAIAASVGRYTRARERTLVALDRIADAALDESASDLEGFLERLLAVMMETTEAVDTAAILLREGDRLVTRAAVGPLTGRPKAFSIAVGEGFSGTIAARGQPSQLRDAANDPLIASSFLRETKVRALYGVPMMRRGEVVGVAHMGSLTAYEFANEDKVLFRTMVGRATSLIEQAQLFQREAAARKQAERALALLDTVFHASPVGMAFVDPELRYLRINESMAAANGVPAKEHLGRTIPEVLPEWSPILVPIMQRIAQTREPLVNTEVTAALPSDPANAHTWLVNYYPVVAPNDELLGVGGVVIDITERKRTEEQLAREAAYRERFIGVLSHDLRNPLTTILSGAQLLLHRGGQPAGNVLRRIESSAQRMMRMIGELLDFSRSRSGGGIPVTLQRCDLSQVVRQVVEELAISAPHARLRVDCAPRIELDCDAGRLTQALSNLVGNALKYGKKDGLVDLEVREGDGQIVLTVHNEGEPIPAALLPRVFDPFARGSDDEGGTFGGLGLGLFIVEQIVTAHGGAIRVDSSTETGTTFTLELPQKLSAPILPASGYNREMAMSKPTKKKAAAAKKPAKKSAAKKPAKKSAAKKPAKKAAKPAKKPAKKSAAKKPAKKAAKPAKKAAKPAKKAAAKKPAQKAAPKKPRVRRDATGHLDPSYAKDLRRLSKENLEHDDDRGFLIGERKQDALAQELGQEFVETVTSGEDEGTELRDKLVSEELGGPFVTSTSGQEFDEEPDESNPVDATREPFPKT